MATLFFPLVILNETTFIDRFLILCYVLYWLFRKNINYCISKNMYHFQNASIARTSFWYDQDWESKERMTYWKWPLLQTAIWFFKKSISKIENNKLNKKPHLPNKLLPYNYKFSPKRKSSIHVKFFVFSTAPIPSLFCCAPWAKQPRNYMAFRRITVFTRINARCHLCHGAVQPQSALALWYIVVLAFSNPVFVGV